MIAYCLYFSTNNFGRSKKSKTAGREKHNRLIDNLLSESKVLLAFLSNSFRVCTNPH